MTRLEGILVPVVVVYIIAEIACSVSRGHTGVHIEIELLQTSERLLSDCGEL